MSKARSREKQPPHHILEIMWRLLIVNVSLEITDVKKGLTNFNQKQQPRLAST